MNTTLKNMLNDHEILHKNYEHRFSVSLEEFSILGSRTRIYNMRHMYILHLQVPYSDYHFHRVMPAYYLHRDTNQHDKHSYVKKIKGNNNYNMNL